MSNLRQAAQAVIDRWDARDWTGFSATVTCIAELRTALAAPEQSQNDRIIADADATRAVFYKRTFAAIRDEPEQEPVAWMHPSRDPHLVSHSAYTYGSASIPLYAAPVDIEELIKERDNAIYACGLVVQRCDMLVIERDALTSAAKLALDFVNHVWRDVSLNDFSEDMRLNVEIALRQAGVR